MASSAIVGGVILALIEGMGIWMNNYFSEAPPGMEVGADMTGPPVNDITAPPTTGGMGMIPTGLGNLGSRRPTKQSDVVTMGVDSSFDSGGHETTFDSGSSSSSSSSSKEGGSGGGWWPFGGSS